MDMARDIITALFLVVGAVFCLLSGIGMVRMPDLFCRLQASTKAGTLGVLLIALASMVYFGSSQAVIRGLLVVAFVFLTAPIAGHVIARASHRVGVGMSKRTTMDALRDDEEAAARVEGARVEGARVEGAQTGAAGTVVPPRAT